MATISCKMCGANLPLTEGASVVECEFCGVRQTVPTADNEKKMALFGRASRLRFACEFDKAAGVYESIVAEFPTEAEAYWGLVLCKYGIEYVDDPATGKKIPTCHRSSFDSVMDDENFEQAQENADAIARSVYREEAKQIEELRKGIIEISGKEAPYDIFICYKETAADGGRTVDSVLAQDVYDALTEKGYRVFFSRITLEDKLGQEYEPYIFAALSTAKVMLAFGTSYENYNAVWVKNEWGRFLQLIAKGEKKVLIPCYKDIDAYDMPKEFARLQAQDMGKIGATQDLLRGIEKLIPKGIENSDNTTKEVSQSASQTATIDTLLKRAYMYLEDKDWKNAEDYCNRILDIVPENASAYMGKLMAETHASREEDLKNVSQRIDLNPNYKRAFGYGDDAVKQRLTSYVQATRERIEIQRKKTKSISALIGCGIFHTVGLRSDGTVLAIGADNCIRPYNHLYDWHDIVAIACSSSASSTVGLKSNGTVVVADTWIKDDAKRKISGWRDIASIAYGGDHVVGLKSDGTVVAAGKNDYNQCDVSRWRDIVSVVCSSNVTIGLKSDGTVVTTAGYKEEQSGISEWHDVVAIACGHNHVVGLKSDGTVVAAGRNESGQCNVSDWKDIVAITCGGYFTVGLKADGTIVAVGDDSEGQCDVSNWRDIITVACGNDHAVGLKSDGTVVATGKNESGQCNVSDWKDIAAVVCGSFITVGIKSSGTIVAVGFNTNNQCNVSGWKLFGSLATVDKELNAVREKGARLKAALEREEREREKRMKAALEREAREREEREREEREKANRRSKGVCQYCGGTFKGVFGKKCSLCGKPKDY